MILDIVKAVSPLIRKIIPDKEKQQEAEMELARMQQQGELKEIEVQMSAIVMEAQSKDKWTSRARPSFLYVIYIYILFAIPFGFLFALKPEVANQVVEGVKLWLDAIPGNLYALFGVGYLGYAGFRTFDKSKLLKHMSESKM